MDGNLYPLWVTNQYIIIILAESTEKWEAWRFLGKDGSKWGHLMAQPLLQYTALTFHLFSS